MGVSQFVGRFPSHTSWQGFVLSFRLHPHDTTTGVTCTSFPVAVRVSAGFMTSSIPSVHPRGLWLSLDIAPGF